MFRQVVFVRNGDSKGASREALVKIGASKGYFLIGATDINLFFLRNDSLGDCLTPLQLSELNLPSLGSYIASEEEVSSAEKLLQQQKLTGEVPLANLSPFLH